MTSMRLLPEEVDAMRGPIMVLEEAIATIRGAITDGDTTTALAYLDLAEGATEKLDAIHERMSEPVPV